MTEEPKQVSPPEPAPPPAPAPAPTPEEQQRFAENLAMKLSAEVSKNLGLSAGPTQQPNISGMPMTDEELQFWRSFPGRIMNIERMIVGMGKEILALQQDHETINGNVSLLHTKLVNKKFFIKDKDQGANNDKAKTGR